MQSYFKGRPEFNGQDYTINLQEYLGEKLIKLPIMIPDQNKILVRFLGPCWAYTEDYLHYKGFSEWIQIVFRDIMHYVADNQDKFDSLEICILVSD